MRESRLPRGWAIASLGDLCDETVRQAAPGKEPVPYIDIGSIDRECKEIGALEVVTQASAPTRARQWVKPGDVLVSMTRPNLNAVALVQPKHEGAVASTGLHVLRPHGVLPAWVSYRVRSHEFVTDVCRGLQGVVYPAIRPRDIRRHRIPVPPLLEQQRVAAALESYFTRLDDAVATLERVQRNLNRYRASVLKAAVEGRLVPTEAELARAEGRSYEPASILLERILVERRRRWEQAELVGMRASGKVVDDLWKRKYREPLAPDSSGLPDLPEGWCWATLVQLGELNRGKSKHRPRNDPRLLGGPYPFIQTADVRRADGFIESYETTYSDFGLSQSHLWPAGTLCITIAANIAETGILKFDACFPDSVVGWLNDAEPTLTRFLELFMRTAKGELERYAPATAQKNINLEVLSELAVPLPPASEQRRIVAEFDRRLSVEADAIHTCEHSRRRLIRLRQSTLQWAFEGKLVDQDPDDEPASVLLERIKAERAAAKAAEKPATRGARRPRARTAKTA